MFNQILDVDIWWHLQLGRSALIHVGFPDLSEFYFSNIFDATSVYRYMILGDILLYVVHYLGGDIGLQFFAAILVFISGFALWGIARPRGVYFLLGLMVFIATTYQLQIIRNAIFSLPLFCLLLRLWWEARWHQRPRAWWWIAPLLTLWSFLHGSYFVGFGVFALICFGDVLDQLRAGKLENLPWRPYLMNLLAAAFGIAIFNHLTFELAAKIFNGFTNMTLFMATILLIVILVWFFRNGCKLSSTLQQKCFPWLITSLSVIFAVTSLLHFRKFFGQELTMTGIDLLAPGTAITTVDMGFWGRVKFGFNNLLWKTADAEYFSSDFLSPFDGLGEIYIWLTLVLATATLLTIFYTRILSFAWLLPWLATAIFALGYKRMVGYWAIFCLFYLLRIIPKSLREMPHARGGAWVVALLLWLFFWGGFGLNLWDAGLRNHHFVGLGRAPIFSNQASKDLLENYPLENVFNTVANGGYLLTQWYPHKKVFIDGFFAPHRGPPLKVYQFILFNGNPDLLVQRLGLKKAIINLYDIKWFNLFNRAPNWYPEVIDQGMVVFQYQPYFQNPVPDLRLYCDLETISKLPGSYRRMVANRIFQLQTGYLLKGRTLAAKSFILNHRELFEGLPAFAEDRIREESQRNLAMAEDEYGNQDSPWLRDEYLYQDALTRGDQAGVRNYGGRIFNAFPQRFELALVLVSAAINAKHISETRRYLLALDRAEGEDPNFFNRNKSQMAEFRYRTTHMMRDQGHFQEAFQQLEKAHQLSPTRFNDDVFFNESLGFYEKLIAKPMPLVAYQVLIKLEWYYPKNPFIQHLLAVTVRDFHQNLSLPLSSALKYGRKALLLAGNQKEAPLDAFRENMAQILEKLGQPEEAAKFRKPTNTHQ